MNFTIKWALSQSQDMFHLPSGEMNPDYRILTPQYHFHFYTVAYLRGDKSNSQANIEVGYDEVRQAHTDKSSGDPVSVDLG